jgi:hypothetical protein
MRSTATPLGQVKVHAPHSRQRKKQALFDRSDQGYASARGIRLVQALPVARTDRQAKPTANTVERLLLGGALWGKV